MTRPFARYAAAIGAIWFAAVIEDHDRMGGRWPADDLASFSEPGFKGREVLHGDRPLRIAAQCTVLAEEHPGCLLHILQVPVQPGPGDPRELAAVRPVVGSIETVSG